jgi:streptogramin lyase
MLAIAALTALLVALALARWPAPNVVAPAPAGAPSAGEQAAAPWQHDQHWPRLPPGLRVGAGSGVAVDAAGHVWLLHRAGRPFTNDTPIEDPTVLRLHPVTGEVERAWGGGRFLSPHGLAIDHDGMLWITDVMANTVHRFTQDGREQLRVGRPHSALQAACVAVRTRLPNLPCALGDDQFARPTDVAVAPDGTFHVADGYRNSRVARFDASGRFLDAWGSLGNAEDELFLPHGIAMDGQGRLLVADRRNARVQVRDQAGRVLAQWQPAGMGRPFGVSVGPGGEVFVADGGDALDMPEATPRIPPRSQAVRLSANGRMEARWGWHGDALPAGLLAHDIAVGHDGSLYIATLDARAIHRLVPVPAGAGATDAAN